MTIPVILLLLIVAPLSGVINVYISAWILSKFGRALKGEATSDELRASILWSNVPTMIILPIVFATTLVGADNMTNIRAFVDGSAIATIIYWLFLGIEFIIGIWSFINMIRMISEVQNFSKWKAFVSMVLPILILAVIMFFVVIII